MVVSSCSSARAAGTTWNFEEFRGIGFIDEKNPVWWYCPARNNVEGSRTTTEVPGTELKSMEQIELLVPATPRTPLPIERVPGRPQVPVQYSSDPNSTAEDGLVQESTREFTQEELNLLASNKVYRSPDSREWFHREEYPDGRVRARAQAKNNKKLYDQMRERGYDDEEFPSWWYSPARSSTMTQEQLPSSASKTQDQLPSASMTQDQLPSDATRTEPLTPVPPRKPLPIEGVPDRPPLSGLVSSDGVSSQTIESHRRSHRKRSICSHRRTSIVARARAHRRAAANGPRGNKCGPAQDK